MTEPVTANPKAFISWAHRDPGWQDPDEAAWTKEVYAFALLLRSYGVDVDLDLFHQSEPGVDWTRYGRRQIADTEWVIALLSRAWRQRWEGRNEPTAGAGAVAEADVLLSIFEDDQEAFRRKLVLVTLPSRQGEDLVPDGLDGVHRFSLRDSSPEQVMPIIRLLTNQPQYPAGPLGPLPELMPVELGPTSNGDETPVGDGEPSPDASAQQGIRQLDEAVATLNEALAAEPEPGSADLRELLWRAWSQIRNQQAAVERVRAEVESSAHGRGASTPPRTPDRAALRVAALELRYDIEAKRRRIHGAVQDHIYWREQLKRTVFEEHGPILRDVRPLVWEPVSFAYMWFDELNEQAPLGTPIPPEKEEVIRQGIGQLEHASQTLRELIVELTQDPAALGPPSRAQAQRPPARSNLAPALDPVLLRGRIYPYMYMPAVDSTEKAFCVRSVAALRVPQDQDLIISSEDERLLLDAATGSSLDAWIARATSRDGLPSANPGWRSVFPTTSTVVTLQRPPVALLFGGGTIEGRLGYNLRPYGSTGATGMAWVNVDVAVRPQGPPIANRWPLSLEDLFSVVCAELSTLLDDGIAGRLFAGESTASLLAVGTVLVTTGAPLGDFVLLLRPSWNQAEGAVEPLGGEWALGEHADVADPDRREGTVRGWIKKLLRDAGISGHEADVEGFNRH